MVLGLGASHHDTVTEVRGHEYGPPLTTMREYLAAYSSAEYRGPMPHGVPPVLLAALRPRMLTLAATSADGAFPYLVPADYVPRARTRLDTAAEVASRPRPMLVVSLACILETDPALARAAARRYLDRYLSLPNYLANLREAGFTDEELQRPGADRVVDALVAWGDEAALRARLRTMLEAGADQVALIPLTAEGLHADRATMEALAPPW
jgi:probable F420-dependent oxidoreductase